MVELDFECCGGSTLEFMGLRRQTCCDARIGTKLTGTSARSRVCPDRQNVLQVFPDTLVENVLLIKCVSSWTQSRSVAV